MIDDRYLALARYWDKEKARVQTWFGISDEETRQYLLDGLPRLKRAMLELKPENMIRHDEESRKAITCTPLTDTGYNDASVCKPDSARRVISFYSHFCTLPAADLRHDCKIKVLIHECSHYVDTFNSWDNMYGTGRGLEIWTKNNSDRAKGNADSIACYIADFDGVNLGKDEKFFQ